MRSRYTAFVLQKAQYLVDTHHPDFRSLDELKSLKKSFKGMAWQGLEIIETVLGQVDDATGIVEFKATFSHLAKQEMIHERSSFIKEQGQWFYTSGTIY
jgi:SEC-C motif-containing protein